MNGSDDLSSCRECDESFDKTSSMVTLLPCKCVLCFPCMIRIQAESKSKRLMCCICNEVVVSHECYRKKKKEQTSSKRKLDNDNNDDDENGLVHESVKHCQQHPVFDAIRLYLQSLKAMSRDDRLNEVSEGLSATFAIYLTPDATSDFGIAIRQHHKPFFLHMNGKHEPTGESASSLITHFRFLHSAIVPLALKAALRADGSAVALSPSKLLEFITQDTRLLPRCLYALATGATSYPLPPILDPYHKSCIFASAIASDVILRAINPQKYVGRCVQTITFQMDHSSETQARKLLTAFRLTTARKTKPDAGANDNLEQE
jgi:hypothetical protein